MSNDYALFIILLSNDFEKDSSTSTTTSQTIKPISSRRSSDTVSALIAPASIPCHKLPSFSSITDQINEHITTTSTKSLCLVLKNYFAEKHNIDPVWLLSDNKKTYEITFSVEFGLVSDRILQDLIKLGVGRRNDTKIFVLPTTVMIEGQKNDSITTLSFTDDITHNDLLSTNQNLENISSQDLTLSNKIRKRINESNFKKSVRARLMVHQVVASIRAATTLSFDFVLLICLASMLAAFGLLENSTVIIVASMLVSPLMNPILGIVFGLSVREHSLWKRGFRNEFIGLIICITCGFIIGLFTTFSETKWGNTSSFPTPEMKSRGDIKRLWVGILIALPSGAGVALSVLGGNTGSLVGVAISASLLPPAVNCGLLFAYSILGSVFPHIAQTYSSSLNNTIIKISHSNLNCIKYINNDYEPFYTCNLVGETAILACCSLILTIANIVCIIIMALFILRIKEVVPLHQPNKDIANFFHHDVKLARDYNRTIHANDSEINNPILTLSSNRNNLAQTIVNRWKTFSKSSNSYENPIHTETGQINNHELNSTEARRKLLHLETFAKEHDLDVFNKNDYDLLTNESREKVQLLINDLIDMCQEIPPIFIDLFRLQSYATQESTDNEHASFYQEIIELLPPKWYQLFIKEQQRRQIIHPEFSSFNRTYSLRMPKPTIYKKSISESNSSSLNQSIELTRENKSPLHHVQRRKSVPKTICQSINIDHETEVPIQGTRFRIARPSAPTIIFDHETK